MPKTTITVRLRHDYSDRAGLRHLPVNELRSMWFELRDATRLTEAEFRAQCAAHLDGTDRFDSKAAAEGRTPRRWVDAAIVVVQDVTNICLVCRSGRCPDGCCCGC